MTNRSPICIGLALLLAVAACDDGADTLKDQLDASKSEGTWPSTATETEASIPRHDGAPPIATDTGSSAVARADAGSNGCGERGSAPYAGACSCDTDCDADAVCVPEQPSGFPGNACMQLCRIGRMDCPQGTTCYGPGGGEVEDTGFCYPLCTRSSDCREGQVCLDDNICFPRCWSDAQCISGHCNLESGSCGDGSETGRKALLEPCLRDEDCRSGACDQTGGRCLSFCYSDVPTCPTGAVCLPFAEREGVCTFECKDESDCPGLPCREHSSGMQICWPNRGPTCDVAPSGPGRLGDPCSCAEQCPAGSICQTEEGSQIPRGFCQKSCVLPPDSLYGPGDECGVDYVCAITQYDFDGSCMPACDGPTSCGSGRICNRLQGCIPYCLEDGDCESGSCNPYNGWCNDEPNLTLGTVGAPCDGGCRGFCLRGTASPFCSALCSLDRGSCPDGATCQDDGNGDEMGYCVR